MTSGSRTGLSWPVPSCVPSAANQAACSAGPEYVPGGVMAASVVVPSIEM